MGTRRGQILAVFLLQDGLLGFAGSFASSALGAAGLVYWHSYPAGDDLIRHRRLQTPRAA
jgi:hypothetical protein